MVSVQLFFPSDVLAEFSITTAYLENTLLLEYLLTLFFQYLKRNVQHAIWRVQQRTILFLHQSVANESEQTGCENRNVLCSTSLEWAELNRPGRGEWVC